MPSQGFSPCALQPAHLLPSPAPPWAQLLRSPPDSSLPDSQLHASRLSGVLPFSLALHCSCSIQGDSQGGHWALKPALFGIYNELGIYICQRLSGKKVGTEVKWKINWKQRANIFVHLDLKATQGSIGQLFHAMYRQLGQNQYQQSHKLTQATSWTSCPFNFNEHFGWNK